MKKSIFGLVLLLASLPAAAVVTVYETLFTGDGNAVFVGDIWLFNCPAGHTFTLSINTAGKEMGYLTADRSGLDPAFQVFDAQGIEVAQGHNDFACAIPPYNGASCPTASTFCGVGTRHMIKVWNEGQIPGGAYSLTLQVRDPGGFEIPLKTLSLGGGTKPRLPKWVDPAKRAMTPLVDDGQVDGF